MRHNYLALTQSRKVTQVLETTNHTDCTNIRTIGVIGGSNSQDSSVALLFVVSVPLCEDVLSVAAEGRTGKPHKILPCALDLPGRTGYDHGC